MCWIYADLSCPYGSMLVHVDSHCSLGTRGPRTETWEPGTWTRGPGPGDPRPGSVDGRRAAAVRDVSRTVGSVATAVFLGNVLSARSLFTCSMVWDVHLAGFRGYPGLLQFPMAFWGSWLWKMAWAPWIDAWHLFMVPMANKNMATLKGILSGPCQPWKQSFQGHTVIHNDKSLWFIMVNHFDSSWWFATMNQSWWIIATHSEESSLWIIVMHPDDSSSWIIMVHHD